MAEAAVNTLTLNDKKSLLLLLMDELRQFRVDNLLLRNLTGWPARDVDEAVRLMVKELFVFDGGGTTSITLLREFPKDSRDRAIALLRSIKFEFIQNTIYEYIVMSESSDEADRLNSLLSIALSFAEKRSISALYVICDLLVDKLLHYKIRGKGVLVWQKYIDLCLSLHPLTLHFLQMDKRVVHMLYRAKAVTFAIGDFRSGVLIDLMIGTEAIRHHTGINAERFRSVAARGRSALAKLTEWDIQLRMAPYLGILDFLDGHYHNAIGNLSLRAKTVSSRSLRAMDDIFVLYEAQSASMLGNFHLGNNILRATIRQATAQGSHTPPSMLQVQCATIHLAQGLFDEALELIDAALNHISPPTDPVGWMCVCSVLAYYHSLNGRPEVAHGIMHRCMTWASDRVFPCFIYQTPYFIELLHDWDQAGLPAIPGYNYQNELGRCLHGPNRMLRAVALRLKGEACFSQDDVEMKKAGLQCLKQSLRLAREIGIIRERGKICVVLAKACMEIGNREKGLAYAMEAWSLKVMSREDPWLKELSALVPAPAPESVPDQPFSAQMLYDQVAQQLLTGEYVTLEQCYAFLVETICQLFGSARGCLLRYHGNAGRLIVLASQRINEEEIAGNPFLRLASLVDEALSGTPIFTAVKFANGVADESVLVTCIPFVCKESERVVLYIDGDIFPHVARVLTPEALLDIGKLLAWEVARFHRRRLPQAQAVMAISRSAEDLYRLVYAGETMHAFLEQVDHAAQSDASVFIYGESGSGKELVARRIHAMSGRKGPFVAVNLSSLPEDLFENEMLGHERGAFTGAMQRKIGFFELANNGTLFIDELPDISQRMQIKLLRILQERSFTRLGSTQLVHSNFRLVVATNRDIRKAVQEGTFREDLYYRICVIQLTIPPLRARKEDVVPIMQHYIRFFSHRYSKAITEDAISPDDLQYIQAYSWPGNVRELKNKVEDAVIHFSGRKQHLCFQFEKMSLPCQQIETASDQVAAEKGQHLAPAVDTRDAFFVIPNPDISVHSSAQGMLEQFYSKLPSLKDLHRMYIERILKLTDGKIDGKLGAANILGITRSALYYHIKKHVQNNMN